MDIVGEGMTMKKKKYYAVAKGKKPGIYNEWFGVEGAEVQVKGFEGAVFKGFPTMEEANLFIKQNQNTKPKHATKSARSKPKKSCKRTQHINHVMNGHTVIYTDGGCISNPGPGGYGAVIINGKQKKELSGGYRLTTNNRMELMACIVALNSLETPSKISLYSDSQYVVNGISKGWAAKWRANGWKKADKKEAVNPDLWEQLLQLCEKHQVKFNWVKGHAGNPENERCDVLANSMASTGNLPADKIYEANVPAKS